MVNLIEESYHKCGRCKKSQNDNEVCWYCTAYLCYECWDKHGHCGHPEAEKFSKTQETNGNLND